ncbi:FG-GAP-like repeat-containing protein [Gemmata sp. JC673]|uniref:FG-GAP-like repeat-containing protein n=1 Tax=Gemmata algarum TaxID=2975278 RepID=A0ABU5EYE8_9BACT|nr:FG-GAP-like repeat-containing protein [Gemmata algarum]MDY3560335.1 FG-GAP-like repeat-containing protein [Gemmata algarum]
MATSPFRAVFRAEELESRFTPVLANTSLAPLVAAGTGYDGVVLITTTFGANTFTGTGFLLPDGRHVLTAAHNFTNPGTGTVGITAAARVSFDMPTAGRIDIDVPVNGVTVHPGYTGGNENDLAVVTLPVLAPSGPTGTLGAERYAIYRGSDEVGQVVTIVGYGTIGTGTTGQQTNEDLTKRMTRNRYETLGDRINYGGTQALIYDFDNGTAANDALGRILGINDLGLPDEGTAGQGDSGGPVFVTVNGQLFVAGTTTSGPGVGNPDNPARLNPAVEAGFGTLSHDTRLSFHQAWIDTNSASPAAQVLDLRFQVAGRDAVADQILVRVVGANLELLVNNQVYQTVPVAGVTSLTLVGAGTGTPFETTATIDVSVPTGLAVTYQRILTATDNRSGGGTSSPPAGAGALPGALPGGSAGVPRTSLPVNLESFPNALSPTDLVAVGAGAGADPRVVVLNATTGAVSRDIVAFGPTFRGGVQTAVGDLNGDFVDDIVVAAGVGGNGHIKVFDGVTGAEIRSFLAFPGFNGAVAVASGDVNGDGVDDIVAAAGSGAAPHVKVFDGATGALLRSFFAFGTGFLGGVSVAAGDVNNDGFADVITGAGAGGNGHVKVFDGATGAEIRSFLAYSGYTGGVFVAAGDVDGDGQLDVVTGSAVGGHIKAFSGGARTERLSFLAGSGAGGTRVAVSDADGDGLSDIVTGTGIGESPTVQVFEGENGGLIKKLSAFSAGFLGGVYVGGRG